MTPPLGPPSSTIPVGELVGTLLRQGHDVRLRLAGVSMRPLFRSGSLVRFSRVEPRVGDIALVSRSSDQVVAHRVVALDGDTVWTKGDSFRTLDAPARREQVLGCATAVDGRWPLPLRGPLARAVGRLVGWGYPRLATLYRAWVPREDSA